MKNYLLALSAAAALVACSDNGRDSTPAAGNAGGGQTASDSFVDRVAAIVATSSDSTEPTSTDSVTPTTPENTEAKPVM